MQSWARRRLEIEQSLELGMHLRRRSNRDPLGTLLYIHGLGESGLCFESLMTDPRLQQWNHLAPDLPGYGKSFWCPEPLGLKDFARRLTELMGLVTDQRIVLVGHSMGGVIGTLLLESLDAEEMQRIAALVNVEGNIATGDCGFSAWATARSLDDWLDVGFSQLLVEIQQQEEDPAINRSYGASVAMCDPRAFHRNSRELVEMSAVEDLAPRLAAIDVAKIFFYGSPRGMCSRALELLARTEIPMHGIEDTGHWFYLEDQDAFVPPLVEFLRNLEGLGS